jgi:hypothetical protein
MPSPKLSREDVEKVLLKNRRSNLSLVTSTPSSSTPSSSTKLISSSSSPLAPPKLFAWDLVLDVRYQDVFAITTRIKAIDPDAIFKELPSLQTNDIRTRVLDTRILLLRISESASQAESIKLLRPPNALTASSSSRIFLAARVVFAASRSTNTQRSIPITIAQIRTPGDPEVEVLRSIWASVPPFTPSKPFEWFKKLLITEQPIEIVRSYFGDSVAFYFSFLESYTQSLFIPAILGLAFFLFRGQSDVGEGTAASVVFATANVVWAATFVKLWRRKESDLALLWGAPSEEEGIDDDDGDISLILDRGSMWSDTDDQLFGKRQSSSSSSSSSSSTSSSSISDDDDYKGSTFLLSIAREVLVSLPVMLLCVSAIVLFISGEESLRRMLTRDLHDWRISAGEVGVFLADRSHLPRGSLYYNLMPNWFLGYVISEIPLLLFLIGVPLLDMVNTSVVKRLVKFEKHSSSSAREASFVSKLALLRILNAHTAPLYVAFIEQDLPALRYRLMFKSVFELVAGNLIPLITTFISEQMAMQKVGGGGGGAKGGKRKHVSSNKNVSTPQPSSITSTSTITTPSTTTPLQSSLPFYVNSPQDGSSDTNKNADNTLSDNADNTTLSNTSPLDDDNNKVRKRFSHSQMPLSPITSTATTDTPSSSTKSDVTTETSSALSRALATNDINDNDNEEDLVSSVHVQLNLGEFSTDDEMLELLNQYSSIILFAAVFPLAAPLAMLHNALEQRSDALKLLHQKRPFPRRIFGVGEAWKRAFELVAVLGALTNAGLAGLSYLQTMTNESNDGIHHSVLGLRLSSLITTITFEHVLLVILTVIYGLIPNKTEGTRRALIQQQKDFKKTLLTTQRQVDVSSLSPITSRIVKTKSSLSLFNSNNTPTSPPSSQTMTTPPLISPS